MLCQLSLALIVALPQSASQADLPPNGKTVVVETAEMSKLIDKLDSRSFRERQQATKALKAAGAKAIGPLLHRIRKGHLELGVRAMAIFERAYRSKDKQAVAAADLALEDLAESDRQALAELAAAVLKRNSPIRTRIALEHLRRFNAAIEDYDPKTTTIEDMAGMNAGSVRPPRLILDDGWTGGAENLKYVKRLAGSGFNIYLVDGLPAPESDLLELEAAFEETIVTRRGEVMLGILSTGFGVGVTVRDVVAGSSADNGGIEEGDRLLKLDGEELHDFSDLIAILKDKKKGDSVEFTVVPAPKAGEPRAPIEQRIVKLKGWRCEPGPNAKKRAPAAKDVNKVEKQPEPAQPRKKRPSFRTPASSK